GGLDGDATPEVALGYSVPRWMKGAGAYSRRSPPRGSCSSRGAASKTIVSRRSSEYGDQASVAPVRGSPLRAKASSASDMASATRWASGETPVFEPELAMLSNTSAMSSEWKA